MANFAPSSSQISSSDPQHVGLIPSLQAGKPSRSGVESLMDGSKSNTLTKARAGESI